MENAPMKPVADRHCRELNQLREAAAQLCKVLSRIAGDETQFYQREKGSKSQKPEDADSISPQPMDIKALKDMVESLKSLTKVVRDLQELPDQPERHNQEIARAKLALAQEQVKQDTGVNIIILEEGVDDYAN